VIFGFVVTGLLACYIPMYNQVEKENDQFSAELFTNNVLNLLIIICTFIILIVLPFTDQLVKIFASGFDQETIKLTSSFTRVSIFAIYFSGIVTIFTGYLQIKGNYTVPALIGLPLNIFVVFFIYLSTIVNLQLLSVGFVIASASQLIIMIPALKKNKFKYKSVIDIHNKYVRKMGYNSIPIILGVSVNQINVLVDRTIASQILVGGVSALNYASRLIPSFLNFLQKKICRILKI
jgi:putative peptidoglycan lipid II flippase